MNSEKESRTIVRLLIAMLALLSVLVVGVAGLAFVLGREYVRARDAVAQLTSVQSFEQAQPRAAALVAEATRRQKELAREVGEAALKSRTELEKIKKARASSGGIAKGPVDKVEQALKLSQMSVDLAVLSLEQWTTTLDAAAKTIRPLATEQASLP